MIRLVIPEFAMSEPQQPLPPYSGRPFGSGPAVVRTRFAATRMLALLGFGWLMGCATPTGETVPDLPEPTGPDTELARPDAEAAGPDADVVERGRSLGRAFEAYGHPALQERRFTHEELWNALGPLIESSPQLSRELLGESVEGREIWGVRYGNGPVRVLLWSQMHGDESTATRALLDLFHLLTEQPEHLLSRRLREALTLEIIPMLNPDGAERFRRRNAQGIDVNRDARALQTPEGRILREAQRRFEPEFAFNLHDQNVRTRVGREDRSAAISLLAPAFDEAGSDNDVRTRAKRVAAVMRDAIEPYVAEHITQYDDAYGERAFGDSMQRWGASTVLLEAGGWRDDPEKSFLRKVNFVAIAAALDAIATGSFERADIGRYAALPYNGPAASDLLVRGGTLVPPGGEPFEADLVINYARPLHRTGGSIVDIGDMEGVAVARDTLDVDGLYVHLAPGSVEEGIDGIPVVAVGLPARFVVREGPAADSPAVWWMEESAPTETPPGEPPGEAPPSARPAPAG